MAVGFTGISPSRGSLATAPIACDGFTVEMPLITLGLWLDGSIVSPIAGRRRGGSHPPVIADCVSLPAVRIVAQLSKIIPACRKGKQAESFRTSPPVSSLKGYLCSLNSKIFEKLFELFHGDVYTEFHCPFGASLHFCNLLIGQTLKIVEDQPPLLYFGQFRDRPM